MPAINPADVHLWIYTYKEGVLSPIAHDLKIQAPEPELTLEHRPEEYTIELCVRSDSLRVVCAMSHGQEAPRTLGDSDKRKIEGNIRREVLHASRHPYIKFHGAAQARPDGNYDVRGSLELHGVKQSIQTSTMHRHGQPGFCCDVRLHQPDFGIKPYTALLGTLKVQPDVLVRLELPPLQA